MRIYTLNLLTESISISTHICRSGVCVCGVFGVLTNRFSILFGRYEQGLEDYEEAVARVEQTKENQRGNNLMNTLSMLSVLNDAWQKVTANRQPSVSGRAMASDDSTIHTEANTPSTGK